MYNRGLVTLLALAVSVLSFITPFVINSSIVSTGLSAISGVLGLAGIILYFMYLSRLNKAGPENLKKAFKKELWAFLLSIISGVVVMILAGAVLFPIIMAYITDPMADITTLLIAAFASLTVAVLVALALAVVIIILRIGAASSIKEWAEVNHRNEAASGAQNIKVARILLIFGLTAPIGMLLEPIGFMKAGKAMK